jgi:metacaspase-1
MAKSALCIGINDYPGTINDLSGCVNDVRDWSAELESRGFKVTTLLDRKATKAAMVEAITRLVVDAADGNTCVFQYSGHGSFVADEDDEEPDGKDEVLCPSDIGQNSYLTDDELYAIFDRQKPGVKLVFLSDSCHSGTVAKMMPMVDVARKTPKSRLLPPAAFLKGEKLRLATMLSRTRSSRSRPHRALLISGCQDVQTSADAWFNNRANGAFTYYALKALRTLSKGATYAAWHKAIRRFLPSQAFDQQPNLYGSRTQKAWKVLS